MLIKPAASEAELMAIETLAATIWRHHYTPIIGAKQVEYMLQKFQSLATMQQQLEEGYEYYGAYAYSRLLGYLAFRQQGDALFLSKIYLESNARGKGYGRHMIDFVTKQARQRRLAAIRLTVNKYNTQAIAAYLKMGFEKVRPLIIDIGGGFVMDDYEMRLQVDLKGLGRNA